MTTTAATMDPNEITRVIDGVYKNILENFNPASRSMIATGKAYLKSLQGASAACSLYLEALAKLSRQAQQSSLGCAGDIGSSLIQATEVFKEIHTQQLSTLKAFYVDFLVPLETNLEKDTRVIQNEQKKFMMCHKQRIDGFSKAASNAKKVRKKSRKSNSSSALDKEIKVIQNLEDERTKLETFVENSLKEALTQERRRYGFILERKTSLAKHYLGFYSKGNTLLNHKLENWLKVAKSREALPEAMQTSLLKRIQGEEDCIFCNPPRPADDTVSISSQLRKTKSMDASEILNTSGQQDLPLNSSSAVATLNRAKSDQNLGTTTAMMNGESNANAGSSSNDEMGMPSMQSSVPAVRPKSLAVSAESASQGFVKALYAYLSSGENQLCFLEGDTIALIGENNKGWQFGENLRTTKTGWFPVAYTEFDPAVHGDNNGGMVGMMPCASPIPPPPPPAVCSTFQQKRMNLADVMVHRTPESMHHHQSSSMIMMKQQQGLKSPKTPTPINLSASTQTPTTPTTSLLLPNGGSRSASDSLHSSNDSGFSNDLGNGQPKPVPPQPDVDYSDDEPQLSNSEDLNSGDKWLMDRYHKSECARLGEVVDGGAAVAKGPRRSLSFGNISASGDLDEVEDRQPSKSRAEKLVRSQRERGRPHQNSFHGGNLPNNQDNNGGALQKFLTRTKSLIWKKGPNNNGNNNNNSGHRIERDHHRQSANFDSISNSGSFQDLWGSHTSIVGALKQNGHDKKTTNNPIYEMKPIPRKLDRELYGVSVNGRNNMVAGAGAPKKDKSDPKMKHIPLPPPPPPPPHPKQQQQQQQQNREEFAIPPPQRRISNKPSPDSSMESAEREGRREREQQPPRGAIPHHHHHHSRKMPEPAELDLSTEEDILNRNRSSSNNKSRAKPRIARVESFSGSEAPIVPMQTQRTHSNNFKNRVGSGRKVHGSRVAAGRSSAGKKAHGRYIIPTSKASLEEDNSEENFEEEEDGFSTPNENDGENDYDDNASSVCYVVETPIPEHKRSGSRSSFGRNGHGHGHGHGLGVKSQSMRVTTSSPSHKTGNSRSAMGMMTPVAFGQRNNQHSPGIAKMTTTTVEKRLENVRGGGKRAGPRIKGSIHSEFHTVELIASDGENGSGSGNSGELVKVGGKEKQPIFDYGSHIHRRLYYPERSSRMDQKSERTGNLCGPCYGERHFIENQYPTLRMRRLRSEDGFQ